MPIPGWYLASIFAVGATALIGRGVLRRRHHDAAARASGLAPIDDLAHLPPALQRTVLWQLADGGFEHRVTHGVLSRGAFDVEVTAFDLDTLRERRGEWASLAVDVPFRIGPTASVVACTIDRAFGHVLCKRDGDGDRLDDDDPADRLTHVHKLARDGLGIARHYEVEPPAGWSRAPLALPLPGPWRAYGEHAQLAELLAAGFGPALERASRRDLVVELIGPLVVVYPAARPVVGADAYADLADTARALAFAALAASRPLAPRGAGL